MIRIRLMLLLLVIGWLMTMAMSSCTTAREGAMKRDCRGTKHYYNKAGGFYL